MRGDCHDWRAAEWDGGSRTGVVNRGARRPSTFRCWRRQASAARPTASTLSARPRNDAAPAECGRIRSCAHPGPGSRGRCWRWMRLAWRAGTTGRRWRVSTAHASRSSRAAPAWKTAASWSRWTLISPYPDPALRRLEGHAADRSAPAVTCVRMLFTPHETRSIGRGLPCAGPGGDGPDAAIGARHHGRRPGGGRRRCLGIGCA